MPFKESPEEENHIHGPFSPTDPTARCVQCNLTAGALSVRVVRREEESPLLNITQVKELLDNLELSGFSHGEAMAIVLKVVGIG